MEITVVQVLGYVLLCFDCSYKAQIQSLSNLYVLLVLETTPVERGQRQKEVMIPTGVNGRVRHRTVLMVCMFISCMYRLSTSTHFKFKSIYFIYMQPR